MYKKYLILILINTLNITLASDIIYNYNRKNNLDIETKKIITVLNILPTLKSVINPNLDTSTAASCNPSLQAISNPVDTDDLQTSIITDNGCIIYKLHEEMVNMSSEADITEAEANEKLGFKASDTMANFIKNNDFEKAYSYFQINFDKDVLYKTDNEGNSIFHLLVQKCNDPKAQDLFMLLTIPPTYYKPKYITPLKIKNSKSVNDDRNKKCQNLTREQVFKKFLAEDFIILKNNKGKTVYDFLEQKCQDSLLMKSMAYEFKNHKDTLITGKEFTLEKLKFLFPQTYREELINFLDNFPEEKALAIVDGINFTNFDFIDPYKKDYVFKSISPETALGKKLFSKFETEAIRTAETGDKNIQNLALYSSNNLEILTVKNSDGKSLLELMRNSSPELYESSSSDLSEYVLKELREKGTVPMPLLEEFLRNGKILAHPTSIDKKFFEVVKALPDQAIKKQILNAFNLKLDHDSAPIRELTNLFNKTNDELTESIVFSVANETCDILKSYEKNLLCSKFQEGLQQISVTKGISLSRSVALALINLIDQATLTGQNTAAFLLINQLAKLNPELASDLLKKLNLTDSTLDNKSYNIFKPILIEKLSNGQLDCSPYRYRMKEFVSKYFSTAIDSDWEDKIDIDPCLTSQKKKLEPLHFIGLTHDNRPLLSAETFEEVVEREARPYKDSSIRVYELTKNGDYIGGMSEAYMLSGKISDIKSVKTILNSATLKSYITGQEVNECLGLCNSLLILNTGMNLSNMVKEIREDGAISGIASLVVSAFFPNPSSFTRAAGTVIGAVRSAFNFLSEELSDGIDAMECREDCKIAGELKNYDELAKANKEKKKIFTELRKQDEHIRNMLSEYKETLNIMNMNSNIEQVNLLKSEFTFQISNLLKEASAINLKFEKIANLRVSNAKEVEILGNEFINARKSYLDQMIGISKSAKEKAKTIIKNSEYHHSTDNEGDPNKFPKPEKPEKPETNTPKTPEEPKKPAEPKTPPENTTQPKEPIVKPKIG